MKKYYKAVTVDFIDGSIKSFYMDRDINGYLCRVYKEGTWTHPTRLALSKGYGLTCFDSISRARKFTDADIWECEIGKQIELPDKVSNSCCFITRLNDRTIGSNMFDYAPPRYWPTGTVMTDKIKLIKRIKWEKK